MSDKQVKQTIKPTADSFLAPDRTNPWHRVADDVNAWKYDTYPDQVLRAMQIGLSSYQMKPYKTAHDRIVMVLESRKPKK